MKIYKRDFGVTSKKESVSAYTIENKIGASVEILTYGGIIKNICVPDKNGVLADVSLGQDSVEAYDNNPSCTGAILGRNANRISGATLTINGKTYLLDKNLGEHNIHGGSGGYSYKVFSVEEVIGETSASLILHHFDDGEGGFPGTVDFRVVYTFTEDCTLDIKFFALPSEDTIINPSSHAYFNLGGHDSGSIVNHLLKINANFYTPNDFECMPTGEVKSVKNTGFDYTSFRSIGDGLQSKDEQVDLCNGYDHNLCLSGRGYRLAAEVYEPISGRKMQMYTDTPGVQLFTSNNMPGIPNKNGVVYYNHQGFCLETQCYPNSANNSHFPSPICEKNKEFKSQTTFCFSVE